MNIEQLLSQPPIAATGPLSVRYDKEKKSFYVLLEGPGMMDYEDEQELQQNNPYPAAIVSKLTTNWSELIDGLLQDRGSELAGMDRFYLDEVQAFLRLAKSKQETESFREGLQDYTTLSKEQLFDALN